MAEIAPAAEEKGPLLDSGAPVAAAEECGALARLASVIMCKLEPRVLDSTPNFNEITQSFCR